jgi:hypothetical protein
MVLFLKTSHKLYNKKTHKKAEGKYKYLSDSKTVAPIPSEIKGVYETIQQNNNSHQSLSSFFCFIILNNKKTSKTITRPQQNKNNLVFSMGGKKLLKNNFMIAEAMAA